MGARFAARFMGAAVDAGTTLAHMRRTATEGPGSLTRMRNANATRVVAESSGLERMVDSAPAMPKAGIKPVDTRVEGLVDQRRNF